MEWKKISDYIFLLLNYNEFVLSDDQFGAILDDDSGEELTGIASPDENKIDEWTNNFFLSAELDANGVPIPINPNYGTPNADKILTIDVNIID